MEWLNNTDQKQMDTTRLQQAAFYLQDHEDQLKAVSLEIYGKSVDEIKDELNVDYSTAEDLLIRGNKTIDNAVLAAEFKSKQQNMLPDEVQSNIGEAAINSRWRSLAVCKDKDPELFFPVGTSVSARAQEKDAKEVCNSCPVMKECLGHALSSGEEFGVWGGLSSDERRTLQRRNARGRNRTISK